MRIGLIQSNPVAGDIAGNFNRMVAALARCAEGQAALAVLPEMWPRSYTDVLDGAEADWAGWLDRWREEVAAAGLHCIGGLPRVAADGTHYNALYLIAPDGSVAARYDKLHMFSLMQEQKRYRPGAEVVVAELLGARVGLAICYDLRFPELYRSLRAQGADLFVTVAQWPAARADHWDVLVRARAVENLAFHVAVNRCGTVGSGDEATAFAGGSAVIGPWGESQWVADATEQVGFCDLNLDAVRERRAGFAAWNDRRFDLPPQPVRGDDS